VRRCGRVRIAGRCIRGGLSPLPSREPQLRSPLPSRERVRVRGHVTTESTQFARTLRHNQTDTERELWHLLRRSELAGYKFRRQVPLGPYIADFVCLSARLIVELDGGQHGEQIPHDSERTKWLEAQNFLVLRFWNNQVFEEQEAVLETILSTLTAPSP
jgi:very-short-patch-repair endonuclease